MWRERRREDPPRWRPAPGWGRTASLVTGQPLMVACLIETGGAFPWGPCDWARVAVQNSSSSPLLLRFHLRREWCCLLWRCSSFAPPLCGCSRCSSSCCRCGGSWWGRRRSPSFAPVPPRHSRWRVERPSISVEGPIPPSILPLTSLRRMRREVRAHGFAGGVACCLRGPVTGLLICSEGRCLLLLLIPARGLLFSLAGLGVVRTFRPRTEELIFPIVVVSQGRGWHLVVPLPPAPLIIPVSRRALGIRRRPLGELAGSLPIRLPHAGFVGHQGCL